MLFTGFSTEGSTQLRTSHPTLGMDNWIYTTSGLTGGRITCPTQPERQSFVPGRADFRFRPGGNQYEAADGGGQFGLTFDDFGHRFICYNRVQVQHVVLPSRYLRRNPHLSFSQTVQDCPAEMTKEPLPGHGASARLYPISQNVTTADSHAGTFTAACGLLIWRGTQLPDSYRGGAMSCDPTANLVHVDRLEPHGPTFAALRSPEPREFLASPDNWFRPVFLAAGPDGVLYVCDMYRKTIEHPDYLPPEVRKHTDFNSGKGMGRIYRVVRADADNGQLGAARRPNLAKLPTGALCHELNTPGGWRRDTVHRLLLERDDKSSVAELIKIIGSPEALPATIVQSLYLLQHFEGPSVETLAKLLEHPAAPVRETAIVLLEPAIAQRELWTAVVKLTTDPDPRVRFQAALA